MDAGAGTVRCGSTASDQAPATEAPAPAPTALTLDNRYLHEKGLVYLTGLQALVRLPLDQNRRDRRAGLRIGTFISGYPGSLSADTTSLSSGASHPGTSTTSSTSPARTRSSRPRPSAAPRCSTATRTPTSTASSVSGTARGRVWTGVATRSSTATSRARAGTARSLCSPAKTTRRRARPCPSRTTTPL